MFRTETEFVTWLREHTPRSVRGLCLGIGDDAAIIEGCGGRDFILKTDMSIEDVHFRGRLHPPRSIGHRALARALSDVAAMGGTAKFALISLAVSRKAAQVWIKRIYAGILALADRFQVAVVGGDTAVVSGKTLIDVVVVGEVRRGGAVRRSGARPGDQLYVSGRLGLSALGLRRLRSSGGPRSSDAQAHRAIRAIRPVEAIQAHLYPEPRCALGRYLSQKRLASALIDLSDGLSTDLGHLCRASGVGASVWAERLPLPEPEDGRRSRAQEPLELALHGGEDYELLFTVPPGRVAQVPSSFRGLPLHHIGEIRKSRHLILIWPDGKLVPLRPAGYDHFRK